MVAVVPLLLQAKLNAPLPPPPVAVAVPLVPLKQLTGLAEAEAVTGGVWLTSTESVVLQPLRVLVMSRM